MSDLTITIPGKPIAKKRPRFARRGKFVTTYNCQETEEGRFMFSIMAQLPEGWQPIQGPVRLEALFMMPIPKTSRRKALDMALGNIRHVKKPDTDNLVKMVKDCANGILWRDDSQVYSIYATKFYAEIPGTKITIRWENETAAVSERKARFSGEKAMVL
jgi:Holliday junction resolvase RusA-like endonuclease